MLKHLKSFLFALALCLATAGAAGASTCYHWQYPGTPFQFCDDLRPDPTPGFTMVSSSYAVQDGEVMFCSQNGTWCEKDRLGAGGFYNGNLGADWSPGGMAAVYTVTSRLHRGSTLYAGANFTGSSFSWGPQFNPQYGPTHPTVNPASFSIQN
jgi:hypothetical protein